MLPYVGLILVTLSIGIYWYITRTFNYWKDRNVISPETTPLFGNLKETALRRKNIGLVFEEIYTQFPSEKVVGVYRMTTPCLLIRDLDIIKHVMIKDFDLFSDRGVEFSKDGLGANLFHADGELWRALRNKFTPIFTTSKLKNMLYLMTDRGDKFVHYIQSLKNSEQEIHGLVQKYTMATITACAFGLDLNNMEDKLAILKKIDQMVLTPNIAFEIDMMFPGILKKFNSSLFPRFVTDFFFNMVKQIVTERNNAPSNRKDFMDLLLELRSKGQVQSFKKNDEAKNQLVEITDGIIAAQAFVFYIAGYETSATTMSFLLYELALNPDIQEKLLTEIDDVIAKHNGQITYECLTDMVYLDKVFKETLRMYSIVDPLQRNALADYKVPGTDVVVKKGQTVLISPRGIHKDPNLYPEPEKFDPERFSVENCANRHPCAYMPFGVGPRNCIGMRFAQTQSRVCIVKLLSKFRIEPSKNTQRKMEFEPKRVIIAPAGGIYLNIVKRK
ncbi:hypothetical protein K1T71_009329 [Dendrolimus kikuchii]|uniref:Uncharacterized protein n=1 Tax=Dendrolimus kikuchii TaxID=765133 RepID=A0ACC1CU85_9NEOP|nr:hypothetical protein K1T71_009329 [Dendrolimus kikuchii]